MEIAARINRTKYDVFRWRYELSIPKKLALVVGMTVLTGLLAQVRFLLPWSPVPITGQTFAALLAGVLLGRWWGGASLAIYAGLGFAGVPWFNGLSSGLGATGGYIIGFVLASLIFSFIVGASIGAKATSAVIALTSGYRGWFFALAFVSIGLDTRFKDLIAEGRGRPAAAFITAQVANIAWALLIVWLLWSGTFFASPIK